MKKYLKIVAIGAGSVSFGGVILTDVLGSAEFNDFDCSLILVDINAESLARMKALADLLKAHFNSQVNISATTDRREALPGADYVITSVAVNRYQLWEQDFRIPLAYGFLHAEGENGGPGAVFHTMRSLELMIPIARDVEDLCPDALLINFTNPESRVVMALNRLTKVKTVGLCHGVFGTRWFVGHVLDRPEDELDIVTGGLNHFFWVLRISDKLTGEDLHPKFLDRIANGPEIPELPPLARKMLEVFGLLTYPADKHPGEYLSFAYEFTGLEWTHGQESRSVPREPRPELNPLDPYIRLEKPLDETMTTKSPELHVPIILGTELDRGTFLPAVNMLNTDHFVENLPRDAVVEVPATVDRSGIHPMHVGPIPEALAAFSRTQISIQKLVVEAYATRSRNLLMQALLLDPLVNSVHKAELMLDEMLSLQKDYLPRFEPGT